MTRASAEPGQDFPAGRRIRRRPEFQHVYDVGYRVRARLLTAIVASSGAPVSRLGVSATRKLGGAVVRNRAKRVVREVFRRAAVPPGLDVVVIPRPELLDADFPTVQAEFDDVLRRVVRRPRSR